MNSVDSSRSSKSSKSASKWARFQERFISYSSGSSSPMSSASSTKTSCNRAQVPLRSSSLPKLDLQTMSTPRSTMSTITPTSALHETRPEQPKTPPKVTPFKYSKTLTPKNKKTIVNETCCFCAELLTNKLYSLNEKIIQLSCSHSCHEECLSLLLNNNHDSVITTDYLKIFPTCEVCVKHAIPLDEATTDHIVSKYLISTPSTISSVVAAELDSHDNGPNGSNTTLHQDFRKFTPLSLQNKNQKELSINIPATGVRSSFRNSFKNINLNSNSRGSSISANSSIITSSISPNSSSSDSSKSLSFLRLEYLNDLIENLNSNFKSTTSTHKSFTMKQFSEFGLLRLVDKLLVSQNGESFKELIVYLFELKLVLVEEDFSNIEIFELLETPKVQTPSSTILKLQLNQGELSIYISQKSNKILQKWIVGLCDYEFIFNSTSFTSSVKTVSPLPSLEPPHHPHELNIPVLLSPIDFNNSPLLNFSETESTSNVNTKGKSIDDEEKTPIVENFFFHKTNNLIVFINHGKLLLDKNVNIVSNIIHVLRNNFSNVIVICCTDKMKLKYCVGIEGINEFSSRKSNIDFSEMIDGSYGSLILTDEALQSTELDCNIKNRLIVSITGKQRSQSNTEVKIDQWEDLMEVLISRYNLNFDTEQFSSDDDSFNSDCLDVSDSELSESSLEEDVEYE